MALTSAMRATLSGHINGQIVFVDVSAELWDRFRNLRVSKRMIESDMLRVLTDNGKLKATEQLVESFVASLEKGDKHPGLSAS